MERSLVIIKPDGMQRGLIGRIIARFEDKGLKIVGLKLIHITADLAGKHYQEHKGKDFYQGLVDYITSCPVIVAAIEGPSAVSVLRNIIGATDGSKASAGTIRGDLAISMRYNLVHGSDSVESADRELALFFTDGELVEYDKEITKWSWTC